METVTRKAWNPDTKQEYEIELPVNDAIKEALLKIDFPPGGLHKKEIADILAKQLSLSDEQKDARLKGQNDVRVFNWYVGIVTATVIKSGEMVKLTSGWIDINRKQITKLDKTVKKGLDNSDNSAEESIEENYQQIRDKLATELLQQIKNNTPTFFEELVVDLLVKMGYGGSREDAGNAVGRSGDGGIDGIINEDRLGLDVIYVQAKRWENSVGEPPVRDFVGALQGKRARKGIFITTSKFSKRAREYISAIDSRDSKVILIDGNQLAQLMIEHDIGVSTVKTYEIKRVDSDYFDGNTEVI